jgi:hypothetical protein
MHIHHINIHIHICFWCCVVQIWAASLTQKENGVLMAVETSLAYFKEHIDVSPCEKVAFKVIKSVGLIIFKFGKIFG